MVVKIVVIFIFGLILTKAINDDDFKRYPSTSLLLDGTIRDASNSTDSLVRIQKIINFFDLDHVASSLSLIENHVTAGCSNSLQDYLQGLFSGKLWALKMDDASGHYSGGYLFGNYFWLGSKTLCENIFSYENDKSNKQADAILMDKKPDLSFSYNFNHDELLFSDIDNPPFSPAFFVIKASVKESNFTHTKRIINLGLCFPSSCTSMEVEKIINLSQTSTIANVLDVRSPHEKYFDLWTDRTFLILLVTTILIVIMLVAGTAYHGWVIYQEKKTKHLENHVIEINNTISDLANSHISSKNRNNGSLTSKWDNSKQTVNDRETNHNQKTYVKVLMSFSIIHNFNIITDKSVSSDTVPCIHGLRAFSMIWVILSHTCIIIFKYTDNLEMRKIIEKNPMFQTIANGTYGVDTFFFISGFLLSFLYLRSNAKGKLKKLSNSANEFFNSILHFMGLVVFRFIRLTAPYMFMLGVTEVLMKYYEQYSVFEPEFSDQTNCPKYWWRNILYINTLFPVEDMCMVWSWYLANDAQFYFIGAVIIIIAVKHFKVAVSLFILLLFGAWTTTGVLAFNNNYIPNIDEPLALFDILYDKPWTRIGGYFIGMAVGWILFKTNCKITMRKIFVLLGWILSLSVCIIIIYGTSSADLGKYGGAIYSALSHSIWTMSLSWIVIACMTNNGGLINKILSAPIIYPISRISFCTYLVHPILIRVMVLTIDAPLHLDPIFIGVVYLGIVLLSNIIALFISLTIEAPVVSMFRLLLTQRA